MNRLMACRLPARGLHAQHLPPAGLAGPGIWAASSTGWLEQQPLRSFGSGPSCQQRGQGRASILVQAELPLTRLKKKKCTNHRLVSNGAPLLSTAALTVLEVACHCQVQLVNQLQATVVCSMSRLALLQAACSCS